MRKETLYASQHYLMLANNPDVHVGKFYDRRIEYEYLFQRKSNPALKFIEFRKL